MAATRTGIPRGTGTQTATTTSDNLVVLSGTPTASADVITENGGAIELDGPSTMADFGGYPFYVGYSSSGALNIANGGALSSDVC